MPKLKDFLIKALWQDPNYEVDQVSCSQIIIEAVDSGLYGRLLSEATVAGAKFEGAKANIAGCDFDWDYDATSQTLGITCIKKPFYATCPEVESKIRELIDKAKGAI